MNTQTSHHPSCTFKHRERTRRAFSLIEVLIAIIILALGLLGLGALFPAVIRQQRIATDQTLGILAAEAAKTTINSGVLTANKRLSATTGQLISSVPGKRANIVGWDPLAAWISLATSGNGLLDTNPAFEYRNGGWWVNTVYTTDREPSRQLVRGAAWIGDPTDPTAQFPIALSERLFPAEADRPQFVWDLAVQYVPERVDAYFEAANTASSSGLNPDAVDSAARIDPPLRAAIFVRRIDPRIRTAQTPTGRATLRSTLLGVGGVSTVDQRSPVGEDATRRPTLDGTDGNGAYTYSLLRTINARFIITTQDASEETIKRDRIYIATSVPDEVTDYGLLRQPGQKIVDNLGNVYNVVGDGVDPALGSYLKVDPPVPASIGFNNAGRTFVTPATANESIRQVVFSPQPPVAVSVVEIRR